MRHVRAAALVLVVSFAAGVARAQEDDPGPLKVTEADFATYQKLRFADAVLAEHKFRTRDPRKLKKCEDACDKTWKDIGWDRKRFEATRDAINEVANLLDDEKGENGADATAALKEKDATTVATVRAHAAELKDFEGDQKRIAARVKEDLLPAAPDAKALDGTWALDLEKTVDLMGGGVLQGEDRKKVVDKLKENTSVYAFSDGKTFLLTQEQGGKKSETRGTYRLEGRKLFLKPEKSERESALDVGMDEGTLLIGSGFAQGAYTKAKK